MSTGKLVEMVLPGMDTNPSFARAGIVSTYHKTRVLVSPWLTSWNTSQPEPRDELHALSINILGVPRPIRIDIQPVDLQRAW
jgi:hypothetical protein